MAGDVFDSRFIWAILFILLSHLAAHSAFDYKDLFEEDDSIVILNHDNANKTVHQSDTFWLVNFYSSWCGHCILFAPTWKDFAKDVKAWHPVVKIAAINCANTDNMPTCRDFNISGYPSLRLFPPHSQLTDVGLQMQMQTRPTVSQVRQNLVQQLTYVTDKYHFLHRLVPLHSLENIWDSVSDGVEHTVVLFEKYDSYLGRELILDMWDERRLLVRRMYEHDVKDFGVKKFPSVYLIEKHGNFRNLATNISTTELDHRSLHRVLQTLVNSQNQQNVVAVGRPGDYSNNNRRPGVTGSTKAAVYQQDLESAIVYSLRQEVATQKTIKGEMLSVLKSYIKVLAKYYPGVNSTRLYLARLSSWLQSVDGKLSGEKWEKQLTDDTIQTSSSFLPEGANFIGCHGSSPNLRGYPCSLWVLFHVLTVNSVLEHGQDADFSPLEVPLTVRGYVTHFFGCRECSQNFNKGAQYMETNIHSADDSILFLWKSHNKANYNLREDKTEDPDHPKVQFPDLALCRTCYGDEILTTDGKPNWNPDRVLKFLKKFYDKHNIVQNLPNNDNQMISQSSKLSNSKLGDGSHRNNALQQGEEIQNWGKNDQKRKEDIAKLSQIKGDNSKVDGEEMLYPNAPETYNKNRIDNLRKRELDTRFLSQGLVQPNFTGLDLSMCVVFYVVCSIIIMLIYFHFTVRRRMKLNGCCKGLV